MFAPQYFHWGRLPPPPPRIDASFGFLLKEKWCTRQCSLELDRKLKNPEQHGLLLSTPIPPWNISIPWQEKSGTRLSHLFSRNWHSLYAWTRHTEDTLDFAVIGSATNFWDTVYKACLMPRSHLFVKQSRKSHVRQNFAKVSFTGPISWELRGLHGNKGVYVVVTGSTWQ